MSDPWYIGAHQHREQQQQQAIEAETRKREEEARRKAEQEAAEVAHAAMKRAIAEATPLLANFLQERGAAARALLAARSTGRDSYIYIGGEDEGGGYFSVSLSKDGLQYEIGTRSGYGSTPTSRRPASIMEAVETFAYYGTGYKNPQKVRDIVKWLTQQIDALLPR